MIRTVSALFSTLTVGLLFTATAVSAASTVTAQLAEAPSERVQIIRNTAWICSGTTCTAENVRGSTRNECIRMARELGRVTDFTVGDRQFSGDQLASCNGDTRQAQAER